MAKRVRKLVKPKFDWSGFKLFGGVGAAMAALGVFLFWATYTAPNVTPTSNALSTTQRLVRMIPTEIQQKIALFLAVGFIMFGLFLILTALYSAVRFIIFKR